MEATARGDLEKLTCSNRSAINHVYADTLSRAIAVQCRSPGAGVSIGRGKALQLPNPAARELRAASAWQFANRGCSGEVELPGQWDDDAMGSI